MMPVFKREHATVIYRNLNIEDDNFLMQQQNQGQNTQRGVLDENKKKVLAFINDAFLKETHVTVIYTNMIIEDRSLM